MATAVGTVLPAIAQAMIGDPGSLFTMKDLKGRIFSLAAQRGNFVVIHFGTSW